MSFENVKPPDITPASKAPVRASIQMRRGQPVTWLSISALGQQELFCRELAGIALDIKVGTGPDDGKVQITIATAGKHLARRAVKGSVRIPVGNWPSLPSRTVKASPCRVIRHNPEGMFCLIELPDWLRNIAEGK